MKKVAILGSTGSIGTQALEVISQIKDSFSVISLGAGKNIELLKRQIKEFCPQKVSVLDKSDADKLSVEFPNVEFFFGENGLEQLVTDKDVDIVLVAVSGKIGLKPTISAIKHQKNIALANKETLVMAGDIVMPLAKEYGVEILPVDSEHSAIFQCLNTGASSKIKPKKLIITASGGPFKDKPLQEIQNATAKEALNHPRWNMGRKITVDSATLMNKGLEVIEAHHLFDMDYDDIKVVIHPQSVIHSAIEYEDGSVIAQMGIPSMHIPIQYALTYPKRITGIETESFDFVKIAQLTFEAPDFEKFPALKLAFDAGKKGRTFPTVLNAANEEAVMSFLDGKIRLTDINYIVETLLNKHVPIENATLEDILSIDEKTREEAKQMIEQLLCSR